MGGVEEGWERDHDCVAKHNGKEMFMVPHLSSGLKISGKLCNSSVTPFPLLFDRSDGEE